MVAILKQNHDQHAITVLNLLPVYRAVSGERPDIIESFIGEARSRKEE